MRKVRKRKARRHGKKKPGAGRAVAADCARSTAARQPARRASASVSRASAATLRWNPEPEDVQKSVAQLVLTIVEFLRQLMERQAIRRMEQKTLTKKEVEAVGDALMKLEETIRDIGAEVRSHARGSQPRSRPARQADVRDQKPRRLQEMSITGDQESRRIFFLEKKGLLIF